MTNLIHSCRLPLLVFLLCTLLSSHAFPTPIASHPISAPTFTTPTVLDALPNKSVQNIYQDRDGFLWICTRNGLFLYNGYEISAYKNNLHHPNLLTGNNVISVAEDMHHRLWIGTDNGLNRLDKRTEIIRKYSSEEVNTGTVACILVTRKGRIFFGTDSGLIEYIEAADTFKLYTPDNTGGILTKAAVKSLCEDHKGNLYIGTWNAGLYRYDLAEDRFVAYPHMNSKHSAHVVIEDSQHRIWISAWSQGLQLIHNPYDTEHLRWETFTHRKDDSHSLSDNIIYALAENPASGDIWIGTRSGLSILKADRKFTNYYTTSHHDERSINGSEVAALLPDRQGLMWVGMLGGGINLVNTQPSPFALNELPDAQDQLKSHAVRGLLADRNNQLWAVISTCGFGLIDRETGRFTHCSNMGEPALESPVSSMMKLTEIPSTGHIIVCVYDGGAFEIDPHAPRGQRVVHSYNIPELNTHNIYDVTEDADHLLWFGTRRGITLYRQGKHRQAFCLDSVVTSEGITPMNYPVIDVESGAPGEMWAATIDGGVLRIKGQGTDWRKYQVTVYNTNNNRLSNNFANCIKRDKQGRIWAGTEGGGLNLYDRIHDLFLPVHLSWNLPGDAVVSIVEDPSGILWLGTNVGLIRLAVSGDAETAQFRLFTTTDGLQDNIFNRGAATLSPDGTLFFGGQNGYNSFRPQEIELTDSPVQVAVTDIRIFDRSWYQIGKDDAEEQQAISALSPIFTDHITLNHQQNNLTIEFSALDYAHPEGNLYSYKLVGFQDEWVYTDASKRFAFYNNLKPGHYTFYLRASNANSDWNSETLRIRLTILPPPWLSWWAYLLYISVAVSIGIIIFRTVRNRIRLIQALHRREMEKQTADELNHAKLQFFTNITHELLTPLTIISAGVEELKQEVPGHEAQYGVITNNIQRLIRLLQQILEFRKAETGNLKLRVLAGDLSQFISHHMDSFRPLMKRKDMTIDFQCHLEPGQTAYFDPDKLDKIIYNLLSNAVKYNKQGEQVTVSVEPIADGRVRLIVADNGPGIAKDAQKNLFKRFYEGDYRKFKTIGTGIGLSLVRDLVQLHHGTIAMESEQGQGTRFIIEFPITKEAYRVEEVDFNGTDYSEMEPLTEQTKTTAVEQADTMIAEQANTATPIQTETTVIGQLEPAAEKSKYNILLVEDNEELLALMEKLLRARYGIFTATQGKEAIEVLGREDISLIVSDVMMPVMDGIELCHYIKGTFETSHIPIILLTAKTQEEDRLQAYTNGADAYITKPFSLPVLEARIDNLLRQRERHGRDFTKQLVFEAKEMDYTSLDEEFLREAIACVNKHLDDPDFDLAVFTDELHVSRSTCARKLKSLTGQSFVSFVRNIRMKAACNLLNEKRQNITIAELAYAVGFSDPRYFSGVFKKEFGMLPSEYLEKNKKEQSLKSD